MAEKYFEINNVKIDGVDYRLVNRKAKVGDKVIYHYENKTDGIVATVTDVGYSSVDIEPHENPGGGEVSGYNHGAYRILEPVEDEAVPKKSTEYILANLAQEVVKLRKQVEALSERTDSNAKDIRTFAETATEAKHLAETVESNLGDIAERQRNQYVKISDLRDDVNMLTDDVILLDERTQSEELAETVLGNITIRRAGRRREVYGGSY